MSGTHPQLVLMIVSIVQTNNVAVTEFVEDVDLHGEVSQVLVILDGADLGRGELPVTLLSGFVNLSESSVPELTHYIPILEGVLLLNMGETFPFLVVTLAYV